MKNNRYAIYSLGIGLFVLAKFMSPLAVSSQLSPADKSIKKSSFDQQEKAIQKGPSVHRENYEIKKDHRQDAINSLSPKNKTVFHSMSNKDQKKIVEAHKNGDDAHDKLTDILDEDAENYSHQPNKKSYSNKNANSPASKAINKQRQNIYD